MDNYAKGYGFLQGSLEMLVNTLEVKMLCEHNGEVVIPEEVKRELKEQISKMLKRAEEVGNEPSEFMSIPEYDKEVSELEEEIEEGEADGWVLEGTSI